MPQRWDCLTASEYWLQRGETPAEALKRAPRPMVRYPRPEATRSAQTPPATLHVQEHDQSEPSEAVGQGRDTRKEAGRRDSQ